MDSNLGRISRDLELLGDLVGHRLRQADLEQALAVMPPETRRLLIDGLGDFLHRTAQLLEVSNLMSSGLPLELLVAQLEGFVVSFLNASGARVFVAERDGSGMIAWNDERGDWDAFPAGRGWVGAVRSDGQARYKFADRDCPGFERDVDARSGGDAGAMMFVPIRSGPQAAAPVIGVVAVYGRERPFGEEDARLVEALSRHAAIGIANALLGRRIDRVLSDESQLLEATSAVSTELNLQPLLEKIMQTVTAILEADRSTLFLHDARTDELWSNVAEGLGTKEIRLPSRLGIAGAVFTSGTTINIPEAYDDARFNQAVDKKTGYRTRSILCMPIVNRAGRVIGVTQALNKRGGPFSADDEKKLRAFSAQAAVAIENARLFEEVLEVKNYNERILESMRNAVVTIDVGGKVTKANQAAAELLCLAGTSDLIGLQAIEVFHGAMTWVAKAIAEIAGGGPATSIKNADLQPGSGAASSVNLQAVPLTDARGVNLGCLLVIEDLTREKLLKGTMERYLTQEVVATILDSPAGQRLGGERRRVSILMSDLRGFTALSERLPPEQVIAMLNEYFEVMVDVIVAHRGTINEIIGDALLVIFGAPVANERHGRDAVACALSMQVAMHDVNERFRNRGWPQIEMGIGVNTGEVVVGNIGSSKRTKYGVVGNDVNLTSRVESFTVGGQILISRETRNAAGDDLLLAGEMSVSAKGVKEPIPLYDVVGLTGAGLRLPTQSDPRTPLASPPTVDCVVLEGKHLDRPPEAVDLIALGERTAELKMDFPLAALANLLLRRRGDSACEIYAKVIAAETGRAVIRFTSTSPAAAAWLESLRGR